MKILDDFISEVKKFGVKRVAKISNVPAVTIYNWIEKGSIPSLVNAQRVANAMGMEFLLFDKLDDEE